jgi:chorismate mutase
MAKPCSICAHPRVADINAAILSGQAYRDIVGRHDGTSRSALGRHRPHIAEAIARAKTTAGSKFDKTTEKQETAVAIKEAAQVETVLDRLRAYHHTIQEILKAAMESKDHPGALKAVSAGLKQLEIEGKILGEIHEHSGSGTGITVQVVYVNANRGAPSRGDDQLPTEEPKQIVEVVSQKA